MSKIKIELDEKYREYLDLLKEVIPNAEGEKISEDSEIVELLIDSFVGFLQEQALGGCGCEDGEECDCGDDCECDGDGECEDCDCDEGKKKGKKGKKK